MENASGWGMAVKFCWLGLLALAATAAQSNPVGDFAPLRVGNVWVYQHMDSTGTRPEGWTTLKVLSIYGGGNTLFYRIEANDSAFPAGRGMHQILDIKEVNGVLRGDQSGTPVVHDVIESGCFSHTFDSSQVRDSIIGTILRPVADTAFLFLSGSHTRKTHHSVWIRGVGLYQLKVYTTYEGFLTPGLRDVYTLVRFNDTAFATPISVRKNPRLRQASAFRPSPEGEPSKEVDALGRGPRSGPVRFNWMLTR